MTTAASAYGPSLSTFAPSLEAQLDQLLDRLQSDANRELLVWQEVTEIYKELDQARRRCFDRLANLMQRAPDLARHLDQPAEEAGPGFGYGQPYPPYDRGPPPPSQPSSAAGGPGWERGEVQAALNRLNARAAAEGDPYHPPPPRSGPPPQGRW